MPGMRVRGMDTYTMPKEGWTCFHCGENFKSPGAALGHFGNSPESVPGCVIKGAEENGLLIALRKSEIKTFNLEAEVMYYEDSIAGAACDNCKKSIPPYDPPTPSRRSK